MRPGEGLEAAAADVPLEALPADQAVRGEPAAGLVELGTVAGAEVGIWEMTPGVATDVEADEVFVVLAGRATIEFLEPALPALEVGPGTVVRLTAGMRTRWSVTETLRKVYVAG